MHDVDREYYQGVIAELEARIVTLRSRDESWRMRMRELRERAIDHKAVWLEKLCFDLIMTGPEAVNADTREGAT